MSPEIIIEIESLYKNMARCHNEYILAHHGTLTMESYPSYCPSGLSQGKKTTKTNEHNHYAEPPETLTENRKSVTITLGFCYKEDIFAPPPHVPLTR